MVYTGTKLQIIDHQVYFMLVLYRHLLADFDQRYLGKLRQCYFEIKD